MSAPRPGDRPVRTHRCRACDGDGKVILGGLSYVLALALMAVCASLLGELVQAGAEAVHAPVLAVLEARR